MGMTIEEAIEELKEELKEVITWLSIYRHNEEICEPKERRKRAIETAIMALEQQPSEDCISREATKEMLMAAWTNYMPIELDINLSYVLEKISELPSVTPKVETKYKWEQTDKIEESNYSKEQYEADLKCAYDCGYNCGYADAMSDIAEGSESE